MRASCSPAGSNFWAHFEGCLFRFIHRNWADLQALAAMLSFVGDFWSDPLAVARALPTSVVRGGCVASVSQCVRVRVCVCVCAAAAGREGGGGSTAGHTHSLHTRPPWPRGALRPPAVFDTLVPPRPTHLEFGGVTTPVWCMGRTTKRRYRPRNVANMAVVRLRHYGARLLTEPALAWTSSSRGTRFENSAASVNRWSVERLQRELERSPRHELQSRRKKRPREDGAQQGRSKFFESLRVHTC